MSEGSARARRPELPAPAWVRAGTDTRLIAAVRARRSLYDTAHPRYMDWSLKVDLWKEIGAELRANPAACKTRWSNIRDNYRKALRRRPGQRTPRNGKYKYADQLAFITKFLRATFDSDDDDDGADDGDKDNKDEKENEKEENEKEEVEREDDDEDYVLKKRTRVRKNFSLPAIKVDYNSDEQQEPMVEFEFLDKKEPASSFPVHPSSMHAVDAFLAGLSPTLKAMSPRHRSLAKAEIFAVVHKYEMKGITEEGGWTKDVNPLS